MNKQEQRIIEAARQVLADWLGGDLTADVGGDFYELESAIKGYEKPSPIDFDWQSFRNQAAKDILCAMLVNQRISEITTYKDLVKMSLECTDELIKQLKEREEK
jgi:hypothetical protein